MDGTPKNRCSVDRLRFLARDYCLIIRSEQEIGSSSANLAGIVGSEQKAPWIWTHRDQEAVAKKTLRGSIGKYPCAF